MKKINAIFIFIFIMLISLQGRAEIITQETAKETADSFLSLDNEWHGINEASIRLIEKENIPAYYVIEYTAGGWAIVSAQSASTPIIGYNTKGEFATPTPMSALLDFNARIITARAKDNMAEHKGWMRIKQRKAINEEYTNTTPDVAPLIKVNLNQSFPFNMYCPLIDGFSSVTGCVAVGMAQAMMVQAYPPRPYGQHSYTSNNSGIISIDYDAEPAYDWETMLTCEKSNNYNDVARLAYHAGVAINMRYGLMDGSGANTELVADALIEHFGYDKKTVYYSSKCPDDNEWLEKILNELVHGRAVIYGGVSEVIGHCWNIDGWKQSTQMVHCNWGWAGIGNGYFSLENMTDAYQDISFLYDHNAVFGITAPTEAPYDIVLHSTQYALGTEAGAMLSYIETLSTDPSASYNYELYTRNNQTSPYIVEDNKLISNETITDDAKFKYLRIKATNNTTGESYEREFTIDITTSSTHKLLGTYQAHAFSKFTGRTDEEWIVTITADKYEPNKVWIRPMCIFSNLLPESISPAYAIYDEANSTLTMPLGQVLFEKPTHKMVTGITIDESNIDTTSNITLTISQINDSIVISFAEDYIFGIGNLVSNKWWYQALYDITFTKSPNPDTQPYAIELSNTTFAIGTKEESTLADIMVSCYDRTASFTFETYDRQGLPSPYQVIENQLTTEKVIADSEEFKHLRIKAINTLTGEWYEQAFDIEVVENMSGIFEGTYSAYAESAIAEQKDNLAWQVTITPDAIEPNKVWIHPILLFAHFEAKDIIPVYATYDVATSTLQLPLGQMVNEQKGYYQFILGVTPNGTDIYTTGNMELQVTHNDNKTEILFDPDYVLGIGNALGNSWWYQAIRNITFTRMVTPAIAIDNIYYNITDKENKCVEVTYKGNHYNEYNDEYAGSVTIPSTITIENDTYTVTSIDKLAFAQCRTLSHIGIPESITTIGAYSFAKCDGLKEINVDATNPPTIYATTFKEVNRAIPIYVPGASMALYQAAPYWDEFTNYMSNSGIEQATKDNTPKITVSDGKLTIGGIERGTTVNIYTITGTLIHTAKDSDVVHIALPHGIYLVQVNGTTHKVVL